MSRVSTFLPRLVTPALFLLGVLLRAADLRRPFRGIYAWNEAYYSIIAANFAHYGWTQQMGPDGPLFTSNPLVPWMIAASFGRFGQTEWAARLPFFLCSLASLIALYGLARALYPERPLIRHWALLCAATMPGLVFFSRNIQLDGPMTACGLVGLWLAVLYRRNRHPAWLLGSLLAMACCITLKYTGALALPAWWVTLGLRPNADWKRGTLLTLLVLVPAAYAIHWVTGLQHSAHADIHGLTTRDYFLRFSEWKFSSFRDALLATWNTQPNHWGRIFWFPFLLTLPWLWPRLKLGLTRHPLIPAMIAPWFLQIGYPVSWVTNEYYDYFALYGVALGLGIYVAHLAGRLPTWGKRQWGFTAAVILLSNLWDYKTLFHVTYFPYDIVKQDTPFQSARLVRMLNTSNAPILAEQSQTMFYANPDPAITTAIWWAEKPTEYLDAIRSRKYRFVVMEYTPPVEVIKTLEQSGYRQIAPGAWQQFDQSQ